MTFAPTLWVALFTVAPSDSGGGTEVPGAGTGYARVKACAGATQALTDWVGTHGVTTGTSSGFSGTSWNAIPIQYGLPTAPWGAITAFALMDAATAGNVIASGLISPNKTVNAGDPAPYFAPGALQFTID